MNTRQFLLFLTVFLNLQSASFAEELPKWGRSGSNWGEIVKMDVYKPSDGKESARKNKLIRDISIRPYSCVWVRTTNENCTYEYWDHFLESVKIDDNNAYLCRSLPILKIFQTTDDVYLFDSREVFLEELGKQAVRVKNHFGKSIRSDISYVSSTSCITFND